LVPLNVVCGKVESDQRITVDGIIADNEVGEPVWVIVRLRSTQPLVKVFHQRWNKVLSEYVKQVQLSGGGMYLIGVILLMLTD